MGHQVVFIAGECHAETYVLIIADDSVVVRFIGLPFFAHEERPGGRDGFDEVGRTVGLLACIVSPSEIFREQRLSVLLCGSERDPLVDEPLLDARIGIVAVAFVPDMGGLAEIRQMLRPGDRGAFERRAVGERRQLFRRPFGIVQRQPCRSHLCEIDIGDSHRRGDSSSGEFSELPGHIFLGGRQLIDLSGITTIPDDHQS